MNDHPSDARDTPSLRALASRCQAGLSLVILIFLAPAGVLTTDATAGEANPSSSAARTWYVDATSGDDKNSGQSEAEPFRKISAAAKKAEPGDTILIRQGTYPETVRIEKHGTADRPIRFKAYPGETPVVTGGNPMVDWTPGKTENQWQCATKKVDSLRRSPAAILIDGNVQFQARQGAETDPLCLDDWGKVPRLGLKSTGFVAKDLRGWPDDYWNGSKIRVHKNDWSIPVATIGDFDGKTGRITFAKPLGVVSQKHQLGYYIFGTPKAMDKPGEWFFDADAETMHLQWSKEDSPNDHDIRVLVRSNGFELAGCSHIEIDGIRFEGTGVHASRRSHQCRILRCQFFAHDFVPNGGIHLSGHHNALEHCEISNTRDNAVIMSGYRNRVVNCWMHDIGYRGITRVMQIAGREHLVAYNTVQNFSRSFLDGYPTHCEFAYNLFENGARLSWDTGVFDGDAGMGNGGNCVIHHNVFRNTDSIGIYLAFYAGTEVVIHHNLVYQMHPGTLRRRSPQFQKIYHNTFIGPAPSGTSDAGAIAIESEYNNNLQVSLDRIQSLGIRHAGNVNYRPADFVDFQGNDFRLTEDASAIDAGVIIPGINDDFVGKAPDAGALERGESMWKYGHDFSDPPEAKFTWKALPGTNRFADTTIRQGLQYWKPIGGTQPIHGNAWNLAAAGKSYYSNQSLGMRPGDGLKRRFTNLEPGAWYCVGANVRLIDTWGTLADSTRWSGNFKTDRHRGEEYVTGINDDEWLIADNVDFGHPGKYSHLEVIYTRTPGVRGETPSTVDVYLDSLQGQFLGKFKFDDVIQDSWSAARIAIPEIEGRRDVFLVGRGTHMGHLRLGEVRLLKKNLPSEQRVLLSVEQDSHRRLAHVGASDWFVAPEKFYFQASAGQTEATIVLQNDGDYDAFLDRFMFYELSETVSSMQIKPIACDLPGRSSQHEHHWLIDLGRDRHLHNAMIQFAGMERYTACPMKVAAWDVNPTTDEITPLWQGSFDCASGPSAKSELQILATDQDENAYRLFGDLHCRYLTISIPANVGKLEFEPELVTILNQDSKDFVASDANVSSGQDSLTLSFPQSVTIGQLCIDYKNQAGQDEPDQTVRVEVFQQAFQTPVSKEVAEANPLWSRSLSIPQGSDTGTLNLFAPSLDGSVRLGSCIVKRIRVVSESKELVVGDVRLYAAHDTRAISNIARLGQASQSSDHYFNRYFNDDQKRDYFLSRGNSSVGNDGIVFPLGNFTSTSLQPRPWWQVDFLVPQRIDQIVLFNRQDVASRIGNFRVSLWDGLPQYGGRQLWARDYSYYRGDLPAGGRLVIDGDTMPQIRSNSSEELTKTVREVASDARLLRVQTKENTLLALSEVQIWQDDTEYRIGSVMGTRNYDFGRADGEVQKGWRVISPVTHGDVFWDQSVDAFDLPDRGVNAINRDGITSRCPATLRHALPNGTWTVVLNLGHNQENQMGTRVWAEGKPIETSLYSRAGEFPYVTFPVQIKDGELTLRFDSVNPSEPWYVTRMTLTPMNKSASLTTTSSSN